MNRARQRKGNAMIRISSVAAMLAFAAGLATSSAALAGGFGGGGGGSGSTGEGDFALRAELQNPRFAEPGSPYGYHRSYSRGPAYPQGYPLRAQRGYRSYGAAPYLYEYQGW
jgi:hypothetical protein